MITTSSIIMISLCPVITPQKNTENMLKKNYLVQLNMPPDSPTDGDGCRGVICSLNVGVLMTVSPLMAGQADAAGVILGSLGVTSRGQPYDSIRSPKPKCSH